LEQEQVMTAITQQLSGTAVARAERSAVPTGGFTLIEIMITVAIVAILAAIAFPGYQQYVLRSKRGLAKSTLVQVLDRQSQFYVDNKSFATDLTALGYAANGFGIDDKGREVAADASNRIYTVTLVDPTAGKGPRNPLVSSPPRAPPSSPASPRSHRRPEDGRRP
jgi:type IV pilus assembly protein PilE